MTTKGLWVYLEALPGKQAEVEEFLRAGGEIVQSGEPATESWYAVKLSPSTYGIFDTFADDSGRNAHLAGRVAASLKAKARELFANEPIMSKIEVLAAKT
jgi:hypothetical protein